MDNVSQLFIMDVASIISTTTAPFFTVYDNGFFIIGLTNGASLQNSLAGPNGGHEVVDVDATAAFFGVSLTGSASSLENDTVRGTGTLIRLIQSVVVDLSIGTSHSNLSGGVFDLVFTNARALGFDPTGTSLISTNVQDAIAELDGKI